LNVVDMQFEVRPFQFNHSGLLCWVAHW